MSAIATKAGVSPLVLVRRLPSTRFCNESANLKRPQHSMAVCVLTGSPLVFEAGYRTPLHMQLANAFLSILGDGNPNLIASEIACGQPAVANDGRMFRNRSLRGSPFAKNLAIIARTTSRPATTTRDGSWTFAGYPRRVRGKRLRPGACSLASDCRRLGSSETDAAQSSP